MNEPSKQEVPVFTVHFQDESIREEFPDWGSAYAAYGQYVESGEIGLCEISNSDGYVILDNSEEVNDND